MSKRGHNEGSIYKREQDGRWVASVSLGYEGGKRVRKTYYGDTRKEVQEQLKIALRAQQLGLSIATDERQTLEQFFKVWQETTKHNIEPTTWLRYEQFWRVHILPTLGRTPLTKLLPQQVQQLYNAKLAAGLSTTTVAHMHATLHTALEAALRLSLIQRNVTNLVNAPKIRRVDMKTLDPGEARAFLNEASSDRLEALYVLALTTGMRQGELLAVKWRDVDLDLRVLQVRANLQRIKTRFVCAKPKTTRSRRKIELTDVAIDALRRHQTRQNEERAILGPEWRDMDLVFCNVFGGPLLKTNLLNRSFKPILERAGVPAIRFHDLRHTAATLLLLQGVHVKVVSEMLGHASISITLDTYSHVLPTMQRDAATLMDALLSVREHHQDAPE